MIISNYIKHLLSKCGFFYSVSFHLENEEEEELVAIEEEKEAMALQQRMASHLDQEDFDFFAPEVELIY